MPRSHPKALERHARRLIGRVTPDNAGKVVSSDIYWTVPFLDLFLEKCDAVAFERPAEAYKLAFHAPSLAHWIRVGDGPGEYVDEQEKRSYRARANAIFGSTCFRIGEVGEAQVSYERAKALLEEGPTVCEARADFLMRWGNFKTKTKPRGDTEALVLFNQALEILTEVESPATAYGLVLRGTWHWYAGQPREAATDYAHALSLASQHRGPQSSRASIAALGNLARILAENQLLSMDNDRALALVHQARKRMSSQRLSIVKAKLFWVEGTLNRKLFFDRMALRLLEKARASFVELQMPEEFVLVSLELALILEESEAYEELEGVRADTVSRLPSMDPALVEVIASWHVNTTRNGLVACYEAATRQLLP